MVHSQPHEAISGDDRFTNSLGFESSVYFHEDLSESQKFKNQGNHDS